MVYHRTIMSFKDIGELVKTTAKNGRGFYVYGLELFLFVLFYILKKFSAFINR